MKNFSLILLILSLFSIYEASAQNTKANAKKLFAEGKYEEAKPVLLNLLKRTPKSAEYNYWYAVCCYETGDTLPEMEDRLKMAASRRVLNAYYYLGTLCKDNERYPEALDYYAEYIEIGKDDKLLQRAKSETESVNQLLRMMKATERICVVDSIVVDKETFLSAYRIGRDAGRLYMSAEYLDNDNCTGVLSMTERETDIYFSAMVEEDDEIKEKLFHASKHGDEWGQGNRLSGFDTEGNDAYPFMSADGSTFYFASDGNGSIGGYDIFVTRLDSETGKYLIPTNLGMPFNSKANDYMMVINEIANLGWFATDRRMPEGKVCVYVFIPNTSRTTYNYEDEGYERMLSLSQLRSISDTQNDETQLRNARRQLTMLMYEQSSEDIKGDFLFVLDDMTDYTTLSHFKSNEARNMFKQWQKRKVAYINDTRMLEELRTEYDAAADMKKQNLSGRILALERRLEEEAIAIDEMEKQIRKLEYERIKKH